MYYLVTASIGVLAFSIHFYVGSVQGKAALVGRLPSRHWFAVGGVAGLASAGLALLTVWLDVRSNVRNLAALSQGKTYDDLDSKAKGRWDNINRGRSLSLGGSFLALFVEVVCLGWFFLPVVTKAGS
jgi:hypothetical protein